MTAGALLQLKYGNADRMTFLTFNPSISHFKSVYKRYTNFAMETISNLPIRNSVLSYDTDIDISFRIGRDGDLIQNMFLTFEFPDIYSPNSFANSSNVGCVGFYNFQWIQRLGEYLVKEVSVSMDSQTEIDKHYSEWFHINAEMTIPAEKKDGYYQMIGHIPEYYDPANGAGCGGTYPDGYKNNPSPPPTLIANAPSIVGRRIILPLRFWFNEHAINSFPLIATQRMEFWINVKLRKLSELFTLVNGNLSPPEIVKPSGTPAFGKFLNPQTTDNSLNINATLETNYIFLEREERKRFALSTHEYLITQLQRVGPTTLPSSSSFTLDLKNINKPVTNLYFILRRTDLEEVNQWSNFTNWTGTSPPYRTGYNCPFSEYPNPTTQFPSKINNYKTPYILRGARVVIEGFDLANGRVYNFDNGGTEISGKDQFYYNLIQPYMFQKNISSQGIYSFSFSLDNNDYQPCGAINMSSIDKKELLLSVIDKDTAGSYLGSGQSYNFNIIVFALNYEIVRIMGGMFGTMTSN
jgi:hypothetical protein